MNKLILALGLLLVVGSAAAQQTINGVANQTVTGTSGGSASIPYVAATGSVNAMVATFSPAIGSLTAGLTVIVLPNLANTSSTPTVNVNGLGAKTITKQGTAALSNGDYVTTAPALLIYDGTGFQLQNPQTISVNGCNFSAFATNNSNICGALSAAWAVPPKSGHNGTFSGNLAGAALGTFGGGGNQGAELTGYGAEAMMSMTGQLDPLAITAIGSGAMENITIGGFDTCTGAGCLFGTTRSGGRNTITGYNGMSLFTGTVGNDNTCDGAECLNNNGAGSNNTADGSLAGAAFANENNSIFIGKSADAPADSQTNQIVICYSCVGNGSNTATIGNSSTAHVYMGTTPLCQSTGTDCLSLSWATPTVGTATSKATFPGGDLFNGGVNAQTGTSYTMVATDENKTLTLSNAAAVAVTLPVASTTGFGAGAVFDAVNLGAGTATITPTTSTINGASSLVLVAGQSARITSDGTNYVAELGAGAGTVTATAPIVVTGSNVSCPTCATSGGGGTTNVTGSITPTGCTVSGSGALAVCTVGSATSTITIAGIPQTGLHLKVIVSGQDSGAAIAGINANLNGDSTSGHYARISVQGTQSSVTPPATAPDSSLGSVCALSATGQAGGCEFEIVGYSLSLPKIVLSRWGIFTQLSTTSNNFQSSGAFAWSGTAAVTTILLTDTGTTFQAGDVVMVYAY